MPGQDWQSEIPKAVKNSDIVIVCLSSKSVTKEGFVQKEIKFALDAADKKPDDTIFIIPARLENCKVPDRIGKFHWVDLFLDDGYERLIKTLQLRATGLGISVIKRKKKSPETSVENTQEVNWKPKTSPQAARFIERLKSLKQDFNISVRTRYPNGTDAMLRPYGLHPGEYAFYEWKDKFIIFLAEHNLSHEIKKCIENTKEKPDIFTGLNSSARKAFEGCWGQYTDMEIDRFILLAQNGLIDEFLKLELRKDMK